MRNNWLAAAISVSFIFFVSAGQIKAYAAEISELLEKSTAKSWQQVNIHEFQPAVSDYVIAHLPAGAGYLVNENTGIYAQFPILSGQRKGGRATPEREWEVKGITIQGDRTTFAKSGRFLRLYRDGKTSHYGIHGHKYSEVMFKRGQIYASLGCLIVADDVLEVIEQSYIVNNLGLRVVTTSDAGEVEVLKNFLPINLTNLE